jgi:protein AbiQ
MHWIVVEESYLNYLRIYDSHVPYSNYGPNKFKPFFGTLFEVDQDIVYITQVSHPQPKHNTKKDDYKFKKLLDPQDNRLIAVVNLAFMFPVKKQDIINLKYKQIHNYRIFSNDCEKSKYIDLLGKEMKIINSLNLGDCAKKLYEICDKYPASPISQGCINFKLLEKYAVTYSIY